MINFVFCIDYIGSWKASLRSLNVLEYLVEAALWTLLMWFNRVTKQRVLNGFDAGIGLLTVQVVLLCAAIWRECRCYTEWTVYSSRHVAIFSAAYCSHQSVHFLVSVYNAYLLNLINKLNVLQAVIRVAYFLNCISSNVFLICKGCGL